MMDYTEKNYSVAVRVVSKQTALFAGGLVVSKQTALFAGGDQ